MDKYSLVYIDDKPEAALTKYLDKEFHSDDYEIECSEIIFKPEEGYESLLRGLSHTLSPCGCPKV